MSLPLSSLVTEIHTRWTSLRDGDVAATPDGLPVSTLTVDTGHGPAALALDEQGRAQLLLPVAAGTRRPSLETPPALEVGSASLTGGGQRRAYLVVTCLDPLLDRAFADLVEAVLTRIVSGEPAKDALVTAISDLGALFASHESAAIDDRIIRGLVAELIVLGRLAAHHPGAPALWFGPVPERHDFRGGSHAIEVKSASRRTGRVTISSGDQMEAPVGGTLQLWRVALERTEGGHTVSRLVQEIEVLTGHSTVLRERLQALGCTDPETPDWNRLSFNCEAIDAWDVKPGFPRIVPSAFVAGVIPVGIHTLTYELEPDVAEAFRVDAAGMTAMEALLVASLP
ncbi:MAG: PD-(D/E)XK motif protein [Brevundimonas sp.]|uniref:PD-(D/E)XK motif protein n=1 Tax=Brevundimonas sp. TaxID=1871086 RepID=UPI002633C540|nr:PD-(D/E)XK motif protein [Brevundimonas sp.]MDI6623098.1 PD-(D/E)XK motif protein [Brevundimonas sp.]MDQ7812140.1 PD-(D/E)XK motif protein [Brevundimonas sp.]